MEYININDITDDNIEKIIINKHNFYCTNCNKKGHYYKKCAYPIISNGIIAIYIQNLNQKLIPLLEEYLLVNIKKIKHIYKNNIKHNKYNEFSGIQYNSGENFSRQKFDLNNIKMTNFKDTIDLKDITNEEIFSNINNNIKFLLVQRKHSLGYLEFMRGRYNISNNELILKLFMQMTPEEISDINSKEFDCLWNNLWDINNIKNKYHHKEYISSKEKFYQLKIKNYDFDNKNMKPSFNFNEWGFPKGRRELYESDIICAMREFEEETYIKENDYIIFEKCNSIKENLIGTNGINYTHNYFLALLHDNLTLENNKNNKEIGNIRIMDIKECIELIRPYHTEKLNIIKTIYLLFNNFIKEYNIDT